MTKQEFLQARLGGKKYIQYEKCKHCNPSCCEVGGCLLLPFDIEPFSVENVITQLDTGKYSIRAAIFSKDDIQFHIQSREEGAGIFSISKPHTRCSLLSSSGCTLSEAERPSYALTLIPGDYGLGSCKQAVSKQEAKQMWTEVRDVMEAVVEHYAGGKKCIEVVTESLEEAAMDIYQRFLSEKDFPNYSFVMVNAITLQVNMYDKIMEIAQSNGTEDKIIRRLVKWESQQQILDGYNAYDVAWRLLLFGPYRTMNKDGKNASIAQKVEACRKYNGYSADKRRRIFLGEIFV